MILSQDMGTMEVITRQRETFTNQKMLCIDATSQNSIKLFYGAGPLHPRRHDLTKFKKLLLMELAKIDTRIRRN
ncbi:hypothetical protein NC651_035981 [Populus alba x Populus x berolinensis]|nr:hypothetical protein NC651_035981 [Populus alba x Populus x berolinensis]